jgi:hypothetical protein
MVVDPLTIAIIHQQDSPGKAAGRQGRASTETQPATSPALPGLRLDRSVAAPEVCEARMIRWSVGVSSQQLGVGARKCDAYQYRTTETR